MALERAVTAVTICWLRPELPQLCPRIAIFVALKRAAKITRTAKNTESE